MKQHQVLDLFAGIGGFTVGLDKLPNFRTIAFCEQDKECQEVLKKNWPDVPIYSDIKELTYEQLKTDGIKPDVITGGFPCQDISVAGRGEGLKGERSGLWFEYARLIGEVGPRWVIIENVSILRSRGLVTILQNLSEIGYDAEWHCITASYVGAPHQRDRIWVLAYPNGNDRRRGSSPKSQERESWMESGSSHTGQPIGKTTENVADPMCVRSQGQGQSGITSSPTQIVKRKTVGPVDGCFKKIWSIEPNVGRVAYGVQNRSHRLKQLGNAVVPQIPQFLGEQINRIEGN